MSTATLSETTATQLTFPWAMPQAEQAERTRTIVAESAPTTTRRKPAQRSTKPTVESEPVAPSLEAAMAGDRIGKSFKVGDVMFRLLKSYGITDEEIAAGVASYNAKRARATAK